MRKYPMIWVMILVIVITSNQRDFIASELPFTLNEYYPQISENNNLSFSFLGRVLNKNVSMSLESVNELTNTVTDNGEDPVEQGTNSPVMCVPNDEDCASVTIESNTTSEKIDRCKGDEDECSITVEPPKTDASITKTQRDSNGNYILEDNELITYTLKVTNTSNDSDDIDVLVRDSLLENLPNYLKVVGDVEVSEGISYHGSLLEGTFVLERIPLGEVVDITYTLQVDGVLPKNIKYILNIATTDGTSPDEVNLNEKDDDFTYTYILTSNYDNIIEPVTQLNLSKTGASSYPQVILVIALLSIWIFKKLWMRNGE